VLVNQLGGLKAKVAVGLDADRFTSFVAAVILEAPPRIAAVEVGIVSVLALGREYEWTTKYTINVLKLAIGKPIAGVASGAVMGREVAFDEGP
jgi:hypothetical protein